MPERELTEVGLRDSREDAEQRGLARSVESEDEQSLAASEIERDVFEHDVVTESLGEIGRLEDGGPGTRRLGKRDAHRLSFFTRRSTCVVFDRSTR